MYDIGKPIIIDVAGTIKELVKWALKEILLFIGVIMFGLSAPLIYTVGAEYLAWRFPQYASTWAVVYLFTGPIACTIWMLFIAPFGFDRTKVSFVRRHVRYMGFGISGFFGSVLAETVLMIVMMKLFPHGGNSHLTLFFAVFFSSFSISSRSTNVRRTSSASAELFWRKSAPSVLIRSNNGLSTSRSRGSHWRVVRRIHTPSS